VTVLENRWVRIGILFVLCVFLMALVTPGAHAVTYTMGQGDTCYIGDYADLALVASWPDFQLAWCSSGDPGCGSPYVVDLGNENQHKVYISKERFKTGNYYRWDGHWYSGENSFAMRVLQGPRPANETEVIVGNETVKESEITMPATNLPNSTHIVMSRGDTLSYDYAISNTTDGHHAFMWMFQSDISGTSKGVLGESMIYRSNDSTYNWGVTSELSEGIVSGKYSGYIQYTGSNNRQDVFYREHHKIDPVKIEYADILDTLYDDDIIPDVNIVGLTPLLIKERFESLSLHEYSDDTLIPVTMTVEDPVLLFTDYSTEDNNITVSGKTPMSAGTIVVFKLDPKQYALENDIRAHTWSTETVGSIDEWRTFNITIPINWEEMAVGANHTVIASVDKNKIHIETSKDFKVSDIWVMPTPTPEREKVIVEDYGWHRVTPTVVVQETTPLLIETPIVVETTTSSNVTSNATQNVTMTQTTSVPTRTPVPRDTNIHVPIPAWIAVLAIAGAVMWRRK